MNTELHSLYTYLISILRKEIEVYRQLHQCYLDEKAILSRSSVAELDENNSRKDTLVLKARMLDETRAKVVNKIIKTLGFGEGTIKISRLLPHADMGQQKELTDCQTIFRSLLERVNELSERNRLLIDASILYVQKSIKFLGQLISPDEIYLNTGRLKADGVNGRIISRQG